MTLLLIFGALRLVLAFTGLAVVAAKVFVAGILVVLFSGLVLGAVGARRA